MKKIISLVLALVMMLGTIPAYATTDFNKYSRIEYCNMTTEETQAVKDFINSFIEEHKVKGMGRAEQLAELGAFFHSNVVYDWDFIRENRTAYAAITKGLTVCVGYSQLAYMYCEALGIPCDIVFSTVKAAEKGQTHVMNMVQMEDGLWYYLDYNENEKENSDGFLFGSDTASGYYSKIVEKSSYSDIRENEVSKEDYLAKFKQHEDEKTNLLRRILKKLSIAGYISYHERPSSINPLYNGEGWATKDGVEVLRFNFYYNEADYGFWGCYYN